MSNYILLTGCSSSIGKSVAKKLSEEGFNLILSGRREEELKSFSQSLNNSSTHKIWVCDFKTENIKESLESFIKNQEVIIESFIHIGGLFTLKPLRLFKKEDINDIFQVNVFSAIEISSLLSKKKYKSNLKNIIFFSSISSIRGKSGYSVYAAAKASLSGLTKNLAIELKPVKVVNLVLGAIMTEKTKSILNSNYEDINKHIPLGIGEPEEIGEFVSYLLQKSNWITGQDIIIDGGGSAL
ncbi:SDR family NAD(P)-dependent oxidoreductase [Aureivirga marina]|uniref:SDR family NAD(P)-dependent oxidoreductase n=1 Tax=Aureivirga marina TaxID=1182451 RepID=UPI0018C8F010|nr:SDR family oxidoreductase [Aureivirga marina]